jgi:hypothetical protein
MNTLILTTRCEAQLSTWRTWPPHGQGASSGGTAYLFGF